MYFAPEKAGGGLEIRLPDAPRSNVNDFWILLIVSHRARARMRLSSLLACALPLAFSCREKDFAGEKKKDFAG